MRDDKQLSELIQAILQTTSKSVVVALRFPVSRDTGEVVEARFSGRSPTSLGAQGNHVSAYALIEACIERCLKDKSLEDALKSLCVFADLMSDVHGVDVEKVFELYRRLQEKKPECFLSDSAYQLCLETLSEKGLGEREQLESMLRNAEKGFWMPAVDLVARNLLTLRNKVVGTAYPAEGAPLPPAGEGARVANAKRYLAHAQSRFEGQRILVINRDEVSELLQAMLACFWYPPVPREMLLDEAPDKYRVGAPVRSNKLQSLIRVTANHLLLVFFAYPALGEPPLRKSLRLGFCELIVSAAEPLSGIKLCYQLKGAEAADYVKGVENIVSRGIGFSESAHSTSHSMSTDEDDSVGGDVSYPAAGGGGMGGGHDSESSYTP